MQATISEAIVEEIAVTEDKPKVTPKINPYVVTTTQKQEVKETKGASVFLQGVTDYGVINGVYTLL